MELIAFMKDAFEKETDEEAKLELKKAIERLTIAD